MVLPDSPTSRINQILYAVSCKVPKTEFGELTEQEAACYDGFWAEAEGHQERYGFWPTFEMGEIEYDDPVLDIYGRGDVVDRTRQVGR